MNVNDIPSEILSIFERPSFKYVVSTQLVVVSGTKTLMNIFVIVSYIFELPYSSLGIISDTNIC